MNIKGVVMIAGVLMAATGAAGGELHRCAVNGVTTITDRPMHDGSCQPINTVKINTMDAPTRSAATNSSVTRRTQVSTQSTRDRTQTSIAEEQLKSKEQCGKLTTQLADVVNAMRSGYSIQQGERLKRRKDQLEEQRRAARC